MWRVAGDGSESDKLHYNPKTNCHKTGPSRKPIYSLQSDCQSGLLYCTAEKEK